MKTVRRVHLYAGLILAPWALMYALSGFIFNHGGWFSDGGGDDRSREVQIDPAALALWPRPDALANAVVTRLNEKAGTPAGASGYRLAPEVSPRFQGWIALDSANPDGSSASFSVNPETGKGSVFKSPAPAVPEKITLALNEAQALDAIERKIRASAGGEVRDIHFSPGRFPKLSFGIERGNERRTAVYDLRSGEVALTPMPEPRALRLPDFLTQLHMSHGYPGANADAGSVRTVRAVFVDAMACVLLFWALSGIAMWLQMKNLRRSGWVVFGTAIAVAILVWTGMYRFFVGS